MILDMEGESVCNALVDGEKIKVVEKLKYLEVLLD